MSFKDIKGQDNAIEFLKSSIRNGKVSHAYVFIGPAGVGKKSTAINFAKALNCLSLKDEEPCGLCVQCKKIGSGNHPDVLTFSPPKEDSSFSIDSIRAITRDIGLRPYEGRKKVYVLEGADSMKHAAQNALLKTLEEPPSDSVLILLSENINALLSTIQSRSKRVRFFPLVPEVIEKILVDNYKLDKDKARLLSRLSSGELDKALKYNDEDFFKKRKCIIDGLKDGVLLDSDLEGLSKSELRLALDIMLTWYRDILITKAGVDAPSALVNVDRLDLIRDEAKRSSFEGLNNMISQVIMTGSFLDQNANPKLAMGVLGLSVAHKA